MVGRPFKASRRPKRGRSHLEVPRGNPAQHKCQPAGATFRGRLLGKGEPGDKIAASRYDRRPHDVESFRG